REGFMCTRARADVARAEEREQQQRVLGVAYAWATGDPCFGARSRQRSARGAATWGCASSSSTAVPIDTETWAGTSPGCDPSWQAAQAELAPRASIPCWCGRLRVATHASAMSEMSAIARTAQCLALLGPGRWLVDAAGPASGRNRPKAARELRRS